jgi:ubiquinone/menaquinone biosynthesis C-methylase UbiE
MPDYRFPESRRAESSRQSLATGFRNVDTSGDADACHRCLDLIAGIPFFREVKEESFRILAYTNPKRVLDAGCGMGTDLVGFAPYLSSGCEIIGLDASESLLAHAAERTKGITEQCSLIRGELTKIPCCDGVFDACRIDRVLQHIREPDAAIHELVRVMKPGGTLVAFDNNWDTLTISLDNQDIVGRIRRAWFNSFASGRIGGDLSVMFETCGLSGIHAEPRTLELKDLSVAKNVFDLHDLLERMVRSGELTPPDAAAVWEELLRRSRKGTFTSGYTGYQVWGTKPE